MALLTALTPIAGAKAEDFSCSFGRGACLDYGDTVCSSGGKCVRGDAQCFDSMTCGYGGFVCKSALDEVVAKATSVATDYDDLVSKYNTLVDEMSDLQTRFRDAVNGKQEMSTCLNSADTLDEAKACGGM